jgi:hypothetical protein
MQSAPTELARCHSLRTAPWRAERARAHQPSSRRRRRVDWGPVSHGRCASFSSFDFRAMCEKLPIEYTVPDGARRPRRTSATRRRRRPPRARLAVRPAGALPRRRRVVWPPAAPDHRLRARRRRREARGRLDGPQGGDGRRPRDRAGRAGASAAAVGPRGAAAAAAGPPCAGAAAAAGAGGQRPGPAQRRVQAGAGGGGRRHARHCDRWAAPSGTYGCGGAPSPPGRLVRGGGGRPAAGGRPGRGRCRLCGAEIKVPKQPARLAALSSGSCAPPAAVPPPPLLPSHAPRRALFHPSLSWPPHPKQHLSRRHAHGPAGVRHS